MCSLPWLIDLAYVNIFQDTLQKKKKSLCLLMVEGKKEMQHILTRSESWEWNQ